MPLIRSITDLMLNPPPKEMQWNKWMRTLSQKEKDIINLFRGQIKNELNKNGILVEIFVEPRENRFATTWGDYAWNLMIEKYGYRVLDTPFILVKFILNEDTETLEPFLRDGLYLQHNIIDDRSKKIIYITFKRILGDYFDWNGNTRKAMIIRNIDIS